MNLLDKVLNYISPEAGARRVAFRNAADVINQTFSPANEPRKSLNASYNAAYPSRVSTYWSQSESMTGVPHLNLTAARSMRDRARSLIDNNILASSILNRATENIIGPNGYQLQVHTKDDDWNRKAEDLFRDWTDTADFYGRTWVQHQRLICNGLLRDGDIGALLLTKGQIQLVEGEYISSDWNQPASFLHDGIELNQYGQISKFWLMQFVDFQNRTYRKIDPKDFIFVANIRRNAQIRGETSFAQSFDLFDQVKGYQDAVIIAQKLAACLSLFVKLDSPTSTLQGLSYGQNSQGQSQRQLTVEPGLIQYLKEGESIQQVTPEQPGNDFSNNLRMLYRILGLSLGLPLELVLLDFSQTNYSSAKASLLQAQNSFAAWQRLLIDTYFRRVYRWRISKFINDGLLEDRDDAFNHKWIPEPWAYLDPVKEIQAVLMAIDAGLMTETKALVARGYDPKQVMNERGTELAEKRKLSIPIYHSSQTTELGSKVKESVEEDDGTSLKVTEAPEDQQKGAA